MSDNIILRVEDLRAYFYSKEGVIKAVNGVSFDMKRGSTLALVGESGAGKTSVALAVLNLLPYPGRIVSGHIFFDGMDLTAASNRELRQLRGRDIAMIFQDPVSGLNPLLTISAQIEESITTHLRVPKREARRRTIELLEQVGLPDPHEIANSYPYQLSGGMCQRVMIAIATALQPKLLIADEPTSALDVTIQASILQQLTQLRQRYDMSILLITHDLGVVARMADEVAIMYAGTMMETGTADVLFHRPLNPYTWALMKARPRLDRESERPLLSIRGAPPDLLDISDQCPFLARCSKATLDCRTKPAPPLLEAEPHHSVACYNPIVHWDEDDEDDEDNGW